MSSHCTSSTKNFIPTQYSMPCAAKSKLNLHFIEFFWGTMKRHLRAVTTYTYSASASKKKSWCHGLGCAYHLGVGILDDIMDGWMLTERERGPDSGKEVWQPQTNCSNIWLDHLDIPNMVWIDAQDKPYLVTAKSEYLEIYNSVSFEDIKNLPCEVL